MILLRRHLAAASVLLAAFFASLAPARGATGTLSLAQYTLQALTWDAASIDARLGPTFAALNPNAADTRPLLYRPTAKAYSAGYIRVNPWEIGTTPAHDGDYWSDSGQVGYIPDAPAANPGIDRIQLYAYYDKVFAISPRLDYASGRPSPEPQQRDSYYASLNGEAPQQPIALVRGYGFTQNEAIVIYRDGLFAVAGTQTSRGPNDRPYPGFLFPLNKVPTAVTVTSENEFALVTIWDTDTQRGQLAVIALEGKYLPSHTWPHMGLPNEGSWSAFKLLGYVDLPMTMPTAVAAASNGFWNGPSQTGGRDFGQMPLTTDWIRRYLYTDLQWSLTVAKSGYAIVASKQENKVAIVDLTPLFAYLRESYLSSAASLSATLAARGAGASQFPQTFAVRPAITPRVVYQAAFTAPTAVLAGHRLSRWSDDHYKAFVATEDGTVHILDTSSIMWRSSWETRAPLGAIGSFKVGRNPTGMCFARRAPKGLAVVPSTSNSGNIDPYNSAFWVACRGDREVVACATYLGNGSVYQTIRDQRMADPVAVSSAVRGPVITVADFGGKKLLSFRIGAINDTRNHKVYGAGPTGTDPFELAGMLPVPGRPFLVGSGNVN